MSSEGLTLFVRNDNVRVDNDFILWAQSYVSCARCNFKVLFQFDIRIVTFFVESDDGVFQGAYDEECACLDFLVFSYFSYALEQVVAFIKSSEMNLFYSTCQHCFSPMATCLAAPTLKG